MGILNRVLNVLTLLVAVLVLVLGGILYVKRAQLRDRGDKMAKVIREVSVALDERSGTKYQDKLLTAKFKPEAGAVDKAKEAEFAKKSLHFSYYKHGDGLGELGGNLRRVLAPFSLQAKEIVEQRNAFAETLNKMAKSLEAPAVDENFNKKSFQDMTSTKDKCEKLVEFAANVNSRNDMLVENLGKIANTVGCKLPDNYKDSCRKLQGYEEPLTKITDKAAELKKRTTAFGDNIVAICSTWELTVPAADAIKGDDYMAAVPKAEASLREKQDKFAKVQQELSTVLADLSKSENELKRKEAAADELSKQKQEIDKLIQEYQRQINGSSNDEKKDVANAAGVDANLSTQLVGKIVSVDNRYGVAVINLGKKSEVRKISAPLPDNAEMFIRRGGQFIGKLQVFKSNEYNSLSNILPGPASSVPQVGDEVFFPPPLKVQAVAMVVGTPSVSKAAAPEEAAAPAKAAKTAKGAKAAKKDSKEAEDAEAEEEEGDDDDAGKGADTKKAGAKKGAAEESEDISW